MKNFKNFIKAIIVDVLPVHGKHTISKIIPPILIKHIPVHGSHAKNKNNFFDNNDIKENYDNDVSKYQDWIHENPNISDIEHNIHAHQNYMGNLSKEERHRINRYTLGSFDINSKLINNDTKNDDDINNDVKHIDNAINKNTIPHNLSVYHGASFDPNEYASKHPERHIKFPTYISTSLNKNIAKRFAKSNDAKEGNIVHRHIIKFDLPEKYNGLYVGNLTHSPEDEKEMILPRNKTFKLNHTPESSIVKAPFFNKHTIYHIWSATPVEK